MKQSKILVDSNSYFRLAQNIHPLLFQSFGKENYTLFVHSDLIFEFKRKPRLRNKFHWVMQPEYVENRKRALTLSTQNKKDIEDTFQHLWEYIKDEKLGPLEVDTRILATAAELGIPVVTDDQDMIKVAELFGIHQIGSMELMKMMLDAKHIEMEKVRQVVSQWRYDNDTPHKNYAKEYRRLFGEAVPRD
ncbi:MAG: DNA-binding protein [Verrucomicrobia bacterium]|nr:DNA-binding protein [Verrucomicrobiota bacterium]MDA1069436.1 DNA-binding protein [Verrucomicrobiota bacterium]